MDQTKKIEATSTALPKSIAGPKVGRQRIQGCQACRLRRNKCDGQRPICSTCSRRNLVCEYYDPPSKLATASKGKHKIPEETGPFRWDDAILPPAADPWNEFHQKDFIPSGCPRCGGTFDSPANMNRHLDTCKGPPPDDDDETSDSSDYSSRSTPERIARSNYRHRTYIAELRKKVAAVELGQPQSTPSDPSINSSRQVSHMANAESETSFMGEGGSIDWESRPIEPAQGRTKVFITELVELLISNYTVHQRGGGATGKENNQNEGKSKSATSKNHTSSPANSRSKRARRDWGFHDDSGDQEEDDRIPNAKRLKESSTTQTPLFACPFAKYDPERYSERNQDEKNYRGCASKYLNTIPRVKQHLYRVHARPSWYCGNCYKTFKNRDELNKHNRERPPCCQQPVQYEEMMTDEQFSEIKRRKPGVSGVDSWYQLFHILFPGALEPASPYVSRGDPVAVQHFVNFFRAVGPSVMFDQMRSWKAQSRVGIHLDMSTETIIDEAFEITLPRLLRDSESYTNVDHLLPCQPSAISDADASSSAGSSWKNLHPRSATPDPQDFSAESIWAPEEAEGGSSSSINVPIWESPKGPEMNWDFNEFAILPHFQTYGDGEADRSHQIWEVLS